MAAGGRYSRNRGSIWQKNSIIQSLRDEIRNEEVPNVVLEVVEENPIEENHVQENPILDSHVPPQQSNVVESGVSTEVNGGINGVNEGDNWGGCDSILGPCACFN